MFPNLSLWWLFAFCISAYFVGSFNTAIFVSYRVAKDKTLVKKNSGNPGATNILRQLGLRWGLLVMFCDMAKGAAAVGIAILFYGYNGDNSLLVMLAVGLSAVFGVCFPVYYKFHGGKGVSAMIGIGLVINPIIMLILIAVYIPIIAAVRIISLCSLTGITAWVILSIFFGGFGGFIGREMTLTTILLYCGFLVFLYYGHRKNIVRLATFKEKRVCFTKGQKERQKVKLENKMA
jgi:glycerol-3-phosphate acyltransferase PlsY